MPFHREALLALFRMLSQRAISKSKARDGTIVVDHVNDLATVKRPKPEMLNDNSNSFSRLNGRVRPAEPNISDIEHLPFAQRPHCSFECSKPLA